MTETPEIHGTCPDRFSGVRDAFVRNFTDGPEGLDEVGARFTVCRAGETLVDLWAGHADTARTRPFTEDTLTPVFSTGKAVMALMIGWAVERGLLDYEAPVAAIWPEFGQAGKADITLAQLMSHQAGLSGLSPSIDPTLWFEPEKILEALCRQAPLWAPGTASGYHPITIGYLAGEVFRRADGRTMGQALQQDFADPAGLDLWLGLPEAEHGRVAQMKKPTSAPDLGVIDAVKTAAFLDKGSAPAGRGSAEWRKMEIPSANMHATAEALARMLALVLPEGLAGKTLSGATRTALTRERISGPDRVLPFTLSWAAGFMRNQGVDVFGANPETVGHCGWGGSCAFADPATGVTAAYVMTRQSPHLIGDPRPTALIKALYAAL
jgi:CubicO group peptidase (beta-lactamase class C family)